MPELIAFLTDYGTRDGFAAVCHGVAATLAPSARILDVTHEVPPHDVRHGAAVLARVAENLPPAVYVGVVDPGVGTSRRGVALQAGPSVLVGPDNGLLMPAADVLGGVTAAHHLTNTGLWRASVDLTFHGRDVFMPVAAHLARGGQLADVGGSLPPEDLVRLPAPTRTLGADGMACEVTYVDRFGNVQLAGGPEELGRLPGWAVQGEVDVESERARGRARVGATFGDVPVSGLVVYLDSDGRLAVAVNAGDAAGRLRVRTGDVVTLRRPRVV